MELDAVLNPKEIQMKLRMKGNSLRLRIARSELARLGAGGLVDDSTRLGPFPEGWLRYSLSSDASVTGIAVSFLDGHIAVVIPRDQIRKWRESNEVGIYAVLDVGNGESLEVAVEKDYACLDRSAEDNEDTFANPHAGKAC
jgi:hypothetical protein